MAYFSTWLYHRLGIPLIFDHSCASFFTVMVSESSPSRADHWSWLSETSFAWCGGTWNHVEITVIYHDLCPGLQFMGIEWRYLVTINHGILGSFPENRHANPEAEQAATVFFGLFPAILQDENFCSSMQRLPPPWCWQSVAMLPFPPKYSVIKSPCFNDSIPKLLSPSVCMLWLWLWLDQIPQLDQYGEIPILMNPIWAFVKSHGLGFGQSIHSWTKRNTARWLGVAGQLFMGKWGLERDRVDERSVFHFGI